MLGFGRKKNQTDTQIPYEVYEKVREPANRRRQWIVRLVAALAVVTILIVGGTALVRSLRDDSGSENNTAAESGTERNASPQPAPANPQPETSAPTTPQPSGSELPTAGSGQPAVNDSTIRKPE